MALNTTLATVTLTSVKRSSTGAFDRVSLTLELFDGSTQSVIMRVGDTVSVVADVALYNPSVAQMESQCLI